MNTSNWKSTMAAVCGLLLCGCVNNEQTVYRDVERVPVEFENEAAGRVFYETFSKSPPGYNHHESTTEMTLPLVFRHKKKVVTGNNAAFNEAIRRCDTNQDGKITETEARIYSGQSLR